MPVKPYSVFEHTADIGLQIYGNNLPQLFTHAARGLYDLITEAAEIESFLKKSKNLAKPIRLKLNAENLDELFLKWMRELLYYFSAKKLLFGHFQFSVCEETHLEVSTDAITFDPKKWPMKREVKAITYHEFKLEKQKEGWVARVIVDI